MSIPANRWVWKHRRRGLGPVSRKASLMEYFWDMLICALSLAETGEAGLQATEPQLHLITVKGGTVVGLEAHYNRGELAPKQPASADSR